MDFSLFLMSKTNTQVMDICPPKLLFVLLLITDVLIENEVRRVLDFSCWAIVVESISTLGLI